MAQHQLDRILLVEEDMHLVGIISEADIRSDEGPMTNNYRWVLPSKGSSRSLWLLPRLPQPYLHDLSGTTNRWTRVQGALRPLERVSVDVRTPCSKGSEPY